MAKFHIPYGIIIIMVLWFLSSFMVRQNQSNVIRSGCTWGLSLRIMDRYDLWSSNTRYSLHFYGAADRPNSAHCNNIIDLDRKLESYDSSMDNQIYCSVAARLWLLPRRPISLHISLRFCADCATIFCMVKTY